MKSFDIGIIGGGPAGASAAYYLSRAGHSVIVFEKSIFPRAHVGESLLPFCHELFVEMDIIDKLNKRFVRKPGVTFMSSDGQETSTYCFDHVIEGDAALSYHVVRADFDKLLLDNARAQGVEVREGCKVTKVQFRNLGVNVETVQEEQEATYAVGFLIDASGQDTFLGSKLRLKKSHADLDRVSFTNHWSGVQMIEGLESGIIQIVDVGGDKQGWMSLVPVGVDRLSISLVLNNSYVRSVKKSFTQPGKDWVEAFYRSELNESKHIQEVLKNAEIMQTTQVVGNYSYRNESKFSRDYAMIGDAGEFLDPIFATGVYLAMKSGKMIAGAINNVGLTDKTHLLVELKQTYEKMKGAYDIVYKFIRIFYSNAGQSFKYGNAGVFDDFNQRQRAFRMQHFLLAGDFFDNHARYLEFLEKLEDPRRYDQYQNLVMKNQFTVNPNCGYSSIDAYGDITEPSHVAE